jgi:hypothetical protein
MSKVASGAWARWEGGTVRVTLVAPQAACLPCPTPYGSTTDLEGSMWREE